MRITASTLVETLVASVIFLMVFMISMMTLTKLSFFRLNIDFVRIEQDMFESVSRLESSDLSELTCQYSWGYVQVSVNESERWCGVNEVDIIAQLKNGYKTRYIYVVEK